jgi:xanthine dehydrogenase small subunit
LVNGRVRDIRIGFGGVAAAERILIGEAWTEAKVCAVMSVLGAALTPISDMRASADCSADGRARFAVQVLPGNAAPAIRTRLENPA